MSAVVVSPQGMAAPNVSAQPHQHQKSPERGEEEQGSFATLMQNLSDKPEATTDRPNGRQTGDAARGEVDAAQDPQSPDPMSASLNNLFGSVTAKDGDQKSNDEPVDKGHRSSDQNQSADQQSATQIASPTALGFLGMVAQGFAKAEFTPAAGAASDLAGADLLEQATRSKTQSPQMAGTGSADSTSEAAPDSILTAVGYQVVGSKTFLPVSGKTRAEKHLSATDNVGVEKSEGQENKTQAAVEPSTADSQLAAEHSSDDGKVNETEGAKPPVGTAPASAQVGTTRQDKRDHVAASSSITSSSSAPMMADASASISIQDLPDVVANEAQSFSQTAETNAVADAAFSGTPVKELDLSLTPAGLGDISVSMRLTGDGLAVTIAADTHATAKSINDIREQITERLTSTGQSIVSLVIKAPNAAPSGDQPSLGNNGNTNGSSENSSRQSGRNQSFAHSKGEESASGSRQDRQNGQSANSYRRWVSSDDVYV
jgi:Flagellar hook-length control protein FliK